MRTSLSPLLVLVLGLGVATGCRQDMHDQPRYEPLEASRFFADGRASRPVVEGTVARGQLQQDTLLNTGRIGGEPAGVFPFPVTTELMERGRQRFDIFCSPCHGRLGNGEGMVVQRGFPAPRSFHEERLRQELAGYFFDVITNGFGRMQSYAHAIPVADRWAIVAYIKALQYSQQAPVSTLTPQERRHLAPGEQP